VKSLLRISKRVGAIFLTPSPQKRIAPASTALRDASAG
jgi:hypothetical protein